MKCHDKSRHSLLLMLLLLCKSCDVIVESFAPLNRPSSSLYRQTKVPSSMVSGRSSTTQLNMVFDFFKNRAAEGVEQLSNLADAASKGKLGSALAETAEYTKRTNEAFAVGLAKSRNQLLYNLESLVTGEGDILEELESVLLQADLGIQTTEDVLEEVKSLRLDSTKLFSRDDIKSILRGKVLEALNGPEDERKDNAIRFASPEVPQGSPIPKMPTVLFIMGANGMGKTTTIGKLAHRLRTEGNQTVLLAACDTFRAGAVTQLEMWADRAEVDCYSPSESKNSPSSVLYGALDKALDENYDTLIIDTSGRLSNNEALTQELAKMKRVIQKRLSVVRNEDDKPQPNMDVPHDTLLVIDAAQGRMALDSAKVWEKEIGLSGLILTKLDGSAKGGSVVAVSRELKLPVKLIGVGEGIDDLRDFEAEKFVDGLLGIGKAGGSKKASEGEELANRLKTMRKERDLRAKEKKAEPAQVIPEIPNIGSEAPSSSTGRGPPRKPKNRSKGKKKRKR